MRSAVRADTSSRRPVKTTRAATSGPSAAAWAWSASASEPSPTTASQVSGTARRMAGIASIRWRCPFSGSSRATTPSSGAEGGIPYSRRSAHGRTGPVNRDRSMPFGTTAKRAASRPSARTLRRDRLGRNDQPVHRRGERRQEPDVVVGADARRVDGGHDHRGAGRNRRPRPDHLRAEHVRVDEVDLLAPQPGHELADGDLVIGRVEDLDRDAQRSEALHGRAGREREGADLVSRSVEAEQQAGVALLRAAVAAGRQQLEDARARMAAGPMDPPMAGVRRAGDGALVVGLSHCPMLPPRTDPASGS